MTKEEIAELRERVALAVRLASPAADRARFAALDAISIEDLQKLLDEREALLAALRLCFHSDPNEAETARDTAIAKAES